MKIILGIILCSVILFANVQAEPLIPDWIKLVAKFWIDGEISDQEFIDALQYLVNHGILSIPQSDYLTPDEHYTKYDTVHNTALLLEFEEWAESHSIGLEGIRINATHGYWHGYNSTIDSVELVDVTGILIAAESLYLIPDDILLVMENKTIYFSTEFGRSTTIPMDPENWWTIFDNMDAGLFLEQNMNPDTTIHELGHVVDFIGIQNREQVFVEFGDVRVERDRIFSVDIEYNNTRTDVPPGFISVYASANDQENFAESFAYYVLYGDAFRMEMENDSSLMEKYEFLRNVIFGGLEY